MTRRRNEVISPALMRSLECLNATKATHIHPHRVMCWINPLHITQIDYHRYTHTYTRRDGDGEFMTVCVVCVMRG